MKKVVVKDGMMIDALNPEVDTASMFIGQDVEIFFYDEQKEGAVPLWDVKTEMFFVPDVGLAPAPRTIITPLSDPRLRTTLSECIDITIQVVKDYCNTVILERYPVYKQMNIMMLMGYTQKDLDTMRAWITGVRNKSNEIEENLKVIKDNKLVVAYNYRTEIQGI